MQARHSPWLKGFVFLLGIGFSTCGEANAQSAATRSLREVRETLAEIVRPEDASADENIRALRQLQAYRYLVELTYKDLVLDEQWNRECLAGAKLCEKLGHLEHKPMNPGIDDKEFQIAYRGTSRSNLAWGARDLPQAVDLWMNDSDESNIKIVGHRRWCLNPAMQKTGFGRSGSYSAMHSFDASRKTLPDYEFFCFPARGYMPVEFFGSEHAWSVSLNPKKYSTPGKDFAPKVYRADTRGAKQGEPLALDFKHVDTTFKAVPDAIIFRPAKMEVRPGAIYVVELDGISLRGSSQRVNLRYLVEFVDWK